MSTGSGAAPPSSRSANTDLCCPPLFQAPLSVDQASALADIFSALGDPVRLCIVSILAAAEGGEVCTCDLPQLVGRSQSTTSYHLKKLVDAGVVERTQRGKWAWFSLRSETVEALRNALVWQNGRGS